MGVVNQKAEKIVMAMKRKKKSFNRLYGDDAKNVMYATANKLAQKEQVHKVMYYKDFIKLVEGNPTTCLLYTSPSPRDTAISRMPSSA